MSGLDLATGAQGTCVELGTIAGVRYVLDQSVASPGATVKAIMALSAPVVLLTVDSSLTGESDLSDLAQAIEDGGVIHVLARNGTHNLAAALRKVGYTHYTLSPKPINELLRTAYALTDEGDVVLLSAITSDGSGNRFEDDAREAYGKLSEAYDAEFIQ